MSSKRKPTPPKVVVVRTRNWNRKRNRNRKEKENAIFCEQFGCWILYNFNFYSYIKYVNYRWWFLFNIWIIITTYIYYIYIISWRIRFPKPTILCLVNLLRFHLVFVKEKEKIMYRKLFFCLLSLPLHYFNYYKKTTTIITIILFIILRKSIKKRRNSRGYKNNTRICQNIVNFHLICALKSNLRKPLLSVGSSIKRFCG